MSRYFRLLCFFHESVSPKPLSIPLGPFQILSKICGDIRSIRCTTGVVDTGGKWKKSSIIKVLIMLFGHLWKAELTYRYIFAFKLTLRSQQPDIVPIICHWCHWHRWQICSRCGWYRLQIDTGISNTSETGGKICRRCCWYRWQICHLCRWYRWCTLTCKYLQEFSKNSKLS